MRRLVGIHGRLPESMIITEEIAVSDNVLGTGGFADVRTGTYEGRLVAVKTMRIGEQDSFLKIRKVSIDDIFPAAWGCDSDRASPAILQRSCPLEYAVPSEHLETCWRSGRYG